MKKFISYMFIAGVAMIAIACEKDSLLSGYEGGVSFNIQMVSSSSNTRAEGDTSTDGGATDGEVTPLASTDPVISPINVRIYRPSNSEDTQYGTLIRRYSSLEEIPNPLYLVAGQYKIVVEGGNKSNKAFKEPADDKTRKEKLLYRGAQNFVIEAHKTTDNIEVACTPINTKVNISFDRNDTEAEETDLNKRKYENRMITGAKVTVVPMAYVADGEGKTTATAIKDEAKKLGLVFESNDGGNPNGIQETGYFLLPESVTTLVYLFEGEHETDGHIEYIGHTSVEGGKAYTVNFRYARTPDGYGAITLVLDGEPTDIIDDKFYFKPQPEMKAEGVNMEGSNDYLGGDITLYCESINELTKISLGDQVIFSNELAAAQSDGVEGVTATATDASNTKVQVTLNDDYFASVGGSLQNLRFKMWDVETEENLPYEQNVVFRKSGIMENSDHSYNLWGNTAKIRAYIPGNAADGKTVTIKFRHSDIDANSESNVYEVTARNIGNNMWEAETIVTNGESRVFPAYEYNANNGNGHAYYKPNTATGIYADNTYIYDLYIGDEKVDSHSISPNSNQPIKGGDFSNSQQNCFRKMHNLDEVSQDWGSGNNGFVTLCMYDNGRAALIAGTYLGNLTAGNMFTGDFKMAGTKGTVSFGMKYSWSARPTALKFKYQANIGTVDKKENPLKGQDQASVLVAIVKWGDRHGVTSGLGDPSGMWSPDNGVNSVGEGEIVGYGLAYPTTETKDATSMTTYYVPIVYYDINTTAEELNDADFSLVISFATSRYGDYMNGCSSSSMYIDDVEWYYGSTFENVFNVDTF